MIVLFAEFPEVCRLVDFDPVGKIQVMVGRRGVNQGFEGGSVCYLIEHLTFELGREGFEVGGC